MAGANSNLQFADLDFSDIKNSLITYLQGQDTFKDYNFSGSGLSTLLDILAYNTQYNAYYLNMVANEMFLDTALQRSSVVSQAKTLNYTPKSSIAPSATIGVTFHGITDTALTLPKGTNFVSQAVNGVNYNFITTDSQTVNVVSGEAVFPNVQIKQGTLVSYTFNVDTTANPSLTFEIPDVNIDTTTLSVSVQNSGTDTTTDVYTNATNYLSLDGTSLVYFLQEGLNGNYEIYFGDGILGKTLINGNIVRVSYLSTEGTAAAGANSFVLLDTVGGTSNVTVYPITSATSGAAKESIDSIKFQAPKAYAAQGRAITNEDYITAIQQNKLGFAFDAVNVWGGQENNPPVYGQVFVSLKPTGAYALTQTQKQRIINEVIKPISVVTVEPVVVDPDYTYIQITANVVYDPKKTTLTAGQMENLIQYAISQYSSAQLNTFNSTFMSSELSSSIQSIDKSIVTNEISIKVQKKFFPSLLTPTTYNLYYGAPLAKGMFLSGISSSPAIQYRDPANLANIIDGIYLEEIPSSTGGIDSISIINPGFGYQYAPNVTIIGDGSGATAIATIDGGGQINSITVVNPGSGYTSAVVTITPQANDTTGQLGTAIANVQGRYGNLRLYYINPNGVKTIFKDIGTVDYMNGVVTLNSFGPLAIDNPLQQLTITANPTTSIISSSYNRIITVDPFDPSAIIVNLTAKS